MPSRPSDPLDLEVTFRFLRGLARTNDRTWFHAHRAPWDEHIRHAWEDLVTMLLLAGRSTIRDSPTSTRAAVSSGSRTTRASTPARRPTRRTSRRGSRRAGKTARFRLPPRAGPLARLGRRLGSGEAGAVRAARGTSPRTRGREFDGSSRKAAVPVPAAARPTRCASRRAASPRSHPRLAFRAAHETTWSNAPSPTRSCARGVRSRSSAT